VNKISGRIWQWLLLLAVMSFGIGLWLDSSRISGPAAGRKLKANLESHLGKRLAQMQRWYVSWNTEPQAITQAFQKLRKERIAAFVWKHDSLRLWNTNALPAHEILHTEGSSLQKLSNGWYLIVQGKKQRDSSRITLALPVLYDYPVQNQVFRNQAANIPGIHGTFLISPAPFEGSVPVKLPGLSAFHVQADDDGAPGKGSWLLLLGIALALISGYFLLKRTFPQEHPLVAIVILVAGLLVRQLFGQNLLLGAFHNLDIFRPEVYASSWYFPSLGDLLINTLLVLGSLNAIYDLFGKSITAPRNRYVRWLAALLIHALIFASANFMVSEIAKLVIDSHISFDFNEIHNVDAYTLLALLIVLMFYRIFKTFTDLFSPLLLPLSSATGSLLVCALFQALPWLFFGFVLDNSWYLITICYIYCAFYLSGYSSFWNTRQTSFFFLRLLAACISISLIFSHYIVQKEHDTRRLLANRILLRTELGPGGALHTLEYQINNDAAITDYFTCEDVTKAEFEKRLRQMYLSKLLENYEVVVMDYDSTGRFYREENPFDYQTALNLFQSDLCQTVSTHFRYIKDHKYKGSYLGRFPVQAGTRKVAEFYVLLQPKSGFGQAKYADIFRSGNLFNSGMDYTYSYAIYQSGTLTKRQGDFGFPIKPEVYDSDVFFHKDGYSHYYYRDETGAVIQVSKTENSLNTGITIFTFLVVISLISVFLLYGLLWLLKAITDLLHPNRAARRLSRWLEQRYGFLDSKNIFLASRIQLFMVLVVFFSFIITLYVTLNYVRMSNNRRQQEYLWTRIHDMANVISNKANIQAIFGTYRHSLLYELSDYYGIDINLYNTAGALVQTSNDRIFDEGFTGNFMHPDAFRKLHEEGKSDLIQNETLGNLNYLSAYYTLFDNDLNVKGYLNLPFFARARELNREISSYVVALVRLFALVFALSAILAYFLSQRITRPLSLIRRQIGLVKLGAGNQPMEWRNNDEIGQLVQEYNKMLVQLEESTDRLADSERQGAWREMAKQVAHEIKNPLTPMKLSLQHLQYAWNKQDEHLDEKFRKTSALLITQIDALSKMAEEFSSFAKMPEASIRELCLQEVLQQAVHLFEQEPLLHISLSMPQQAILLRADQDQLLRVFTNIIKNALQAISDGTEGRLEIQLRQLDGVAILSFKDNGRGIPPELYDRIFSPNFSTKNSGMGLGLAISRKIIESFGGSISFSSRLNQGSTFVVKLPLTPM
jgi:signal transduction histidine kinase